MASNGLEKRAKRGRCRMCQRMRNTDNQVHEVSEVHKGFATGYVWECIDREECDAAAARRLAGELKVVTRARIERAQEVGRLTKFVVYIQ